MALLQYNWKTIQAGDQPDRKYFCRPGYEEKFKLKSHDLCKLVDTKAMAECINAVPRIQKTNPLNGCISLIDLEHKSIQDLLANYDGQGPEQLQGYLTGNWYLTALPQILNPFRKGEPTAKVFLMYNPDQDCPVIFIEKNEKGSPVDRQNILGIHLHPSETNKNREKRLWLKRDYLKLLEQYADRQDRSMRSISLRYGELSFVHHRDREGQEYEYSDQFGLVEI